jgi:hypothetical protein
MRYNCSLYNFDPCNPLDWLLYEFYLSKEQVLLATIQANEKYYETILTELLNRAKEEPGVRQFLEDLRRYLCILSKRAMEQCDSIAQACTLDAKLSLLANLPIGADEKAIQLLGISSSHSTLRDSILKTILPTDLQEIYYGQKGCTPLMK